MQPKKYQVFVSSTYRDLVKERQDAIKAIIDLGHLPSGMEGFPAIDMEQFEYIKKVIDQCDYYLLIVGDRYGSIAHDGMSFTEKEYRYARATGQVVLAFVKDPQDKSQSDGRDKELSTFRDEVMSIRVVHRWNAGDDLKYPVSRSLQEAFDQHPRIGWTRVEKSIDSGEVAGVALHRVEYGKSNLAKIIAFGGMALFAAALSGAIMMKAPTERQTTLDRSIDAQPAVPTQTQPLPYSQPRPQPMPTLSAEEQATKLSIWDSIATINLNLLVTAYNSIDLAQSRWTQLVGSANGRKQLSSDLSQAVGAYRHAYQEVEILKSEYPQYEDVASALTQSNVFDFGSAVDNFSNAVGAVSENDPPKDPDVKIRPLAGALRREMNTTQQWLNTLSRVANQKRSDLTSAK